MDLLSPISCPIQENALLTLQYGLSTYLAFGSSSRFVFNSPITMSFGIELLCILYTTSAITKTRVPTIAYFCLKGFSCAPFAFISEGANNDFAALILHGSDGSSTTNTHNSPGYARFLFFRGTRSESPKGLNNGFSILGFLSRLDTNNAGFDLINTVFLATYLQIHRI